MQNVTSTKAKTKKKQESNTTKPITLVKRKNKCLNIEKIEVTV